jgi:ABC-2 type transport system permease protein
MNMEPNTLESGVTAPVPTLPESQTRIATRPLYWSVLRELWENKSLYIAPAIVAAVLLVGALVSSGYLPERRRNAMLLDEVRRRAAIELPYNIVAMMLIVTAFIIGFFYCLDALYGERATAAFCFEIVAGPDLNDRSFQGDHPAAICR